MFLKLLPSCKSVHPLQRSYLKYPLEDHIVNKSIILAENNSFLLLLHHEDWGDLVSVKVFTPKYRYCSITFNDNVPYLLQDMWRAVCPCGWSCGPSGARTAWTPSHTGCRSTCDCWCAWSCGGSACWPWRRPRYSPAAQQQHSPRVSGSLNMYSPAAQQQQHSPRVSGSLKQQLRRL